MEMSNIKAELSQMKASKDETEREINKLRAHYEQQMADVDAKDASQYPVYRK